MRIELEVKFDHQLGIEVVEFRVGDGLLNRDPIVTSLSVFENIISTAGATTSNANIAQNLHGIGRFFTRGAVYTIFLESAHDVLTNSFYYWQNPDSPNRDADMQALVGRTFLTYANIGATLVTNKAVLAGLGIAGIAGAPLFLSLVGVTLLAGMAGVAIADSPQLQQAVGRWITNATKDFLEPGEFNATNAWIYWRAYYYAKDRGVPESDPALSELRGLAAQAGQDVWGSNWTIEDFGLNERNFPYGDRLSMNATLLRWPGAFMYAWDQWREANDLLTSTIQSEHLKEFWQSEFIPSAIRKQRILIDPVEGVLVRLIGDNVMGRYDIRCDFNLDDFLDGKTGRPIEFLYDPRTNVVLGANGRHAPKSAITGPCECEDCVPPECEDNCECERCAPTEPNPEPRPCPPGCNCAVCRAMREADGEELRARDVVSPLVIDLSRTGITKIGKENGVHFDLDNTGFAQRTAWIGGGAGFLALDLNGNGVIDNGGELFGDFTLLPDGSRARDGFDALRQFDIHGTGVIDKNNPIFQYLVVWVDKNGDGISTPDEIFTLAELGIVAINLNTTAVNTTCPETGILLTCVSTVVFADGSEAKIGDFWFPNCGWDTWCLSDIEISAEIAALPNVRSFGSAHTLHVAMAKDESGELIELVRQFKNGATVEERQLTLRKILHRLTGAADIAPNSRGSNIDARDLHVIETMLGRQYFGAAAGNSGANPGPNGARVLQNSFNIIADMYYTLLIGQTFLKDYLRMIAEHGVSTGKEFDVTIFKDLMQARMAEGINVDEQILEMGRYIRFTFGADSNNYRDFLSLHISLSAEFASLFSQLGSEFIAGTAGINGTLRGGSGNNIFFGGQGEDTLIGGTGRNTYIWKLGHGNDIINDHARDKDANGWGGTLKIGAGVNPANAEISRVGNNLILVIGETGERLTIQNWFSGADHQLIDIRFADGTVWSRADVNEMSPVIRGADGNVAVNGFVNSNDILIGGNGNNTMRGNGGNNIFIGGQGDDTKIGGNGRNTYKWSPGDGNDTIDDHANNKDANGWGGTLLFGEGVDPANIKLTVEIVERTPLCGSVQRIHLVLVIGETGERITIQNWFSGADHQLIDIRFADGTVWSRAEINQMPIVIHAPDEPNSTIFAFDGRKNILIGSAVSNTMRGGDGKNIFIGGQGDDHKHGGTGINIYKWSPGDGNDLIFNNGCGTLVFGEGVNPANVELSKGSTRNDLVLTIAETGERISIFNWYNSVNNQLTQIKFADGTVWSREEINQMPIVVRAGWGGRVAGFNGMDNILLGNDIGDSRNNTMYGFDGNNTFIGGRGDDLKIGGNGRNTYKWEPGHGNDTINDHANNKDANGWGGTLKIGEGVDPANVTTARENNNLVLTIGETGERITIQDWFRGADWQLVRIEFADGTYWNRSSGQSIETFFQEQAELAASALPSSVIRGSDEGSLVIGEGVNPASVEITRVGNNLILIIAETGERITIHDWYRGADHQLIQIKFADGTVWSRADINQMTAVIRGADGGGYVDGFNNMQNILIGGSGNDTLRGNSGDNIFIGGKGDDLKVGGNGRNTYKWFLGDGNDIIDDWAEHKDANGWGGTLVIGEGVDPANVEITRVGNNLILIIAETGERITVQDWFLSVNHQLIQIEFADGTVWSRTDINHMPVVIRGADGGGYVDGFSNMQNILIGGNGNDTLRVNNGSNVNNIFIGGKGDDLKIGGSGRNIYKWSLGDGNDIIDDTREHFVGGILKFGEGVNPAKVIPTMEGFNLVLTVWQTGERITILDWSRNTAWRQDIGRLSRIEFADGTYWSRFSGQSVEDFFSEQAKLAEASGQSLVLRAADGGSTVTTSGSANFTLIGGNGNDTLRGNSGNNTFIGGQGDDLKVGGDGRSTYKWFLGDGNDTINDNAWNKDANGWGGTLVIGEGVNPANVEITRVGNDLILIIAESGERITIQNWYQNADWQLVDIQFADGTVWSRADINVMSPILRGADGGTAVTAAGNTNDILIGGSGNDILRGNNGNNTFIGGQGDDLKVGGNGRNTYKWSLNDGNDTINDFAWNKDANGWGGTLVIGEGVNPANVEIARVENNLIFIIAESGERITIQNWYRGADDQLLQVKFSDGTVWSRADINQMAAVVRGADGGGTVDGFADMNNIIIGGSGNNTMRGNGGNNVFIGGQGNDTKIGGNGRNTYKWSLGDGNDIINDHAANKDANGWGGTLKFGEGVDPASIEISRIGNDLILIIAESGERLTIQNWYQNADWQLVDIQFADGTVWSRADINAMSPVLRGTDENNNTIHGFANQNNIFIGGQGNDTKVGGSGRNTYKWELGHGNDTINDHANNKDANGWGGTLVIGKGVNPDNVEITRVGNNLIFIIAESGERITIQNWYRGADDQLLQVKFSDGTVWSRADINQMTTVIRGADGGGIVDGFAGMNNIIIGGNGNNTMRGNGGNNVFIGGQGNDTKTGGNGRNTYKWSLGDGNDIINDHATRKDDNGWGGTLKFGEGVDPANIEINRSGNNLILVIAETGERLTIQDWHRGSDWQLIDIRFADGTVWSRADVNEMSPVIRGADGVVAVNGFANSNDILIGSNVNNTMRGNGGNNVFIGGQGNDTKIGGNGRNTYKWSLGDGNDIINDHAANKDANGWGGTLKFGEGVNPANIEISRVSNNLILIIAETGERLTIQNWFSGVDHQLIDIRFADGTVWSRADVNAMSPVIRGADGVVAVNGFANSNDILIGSNVNNTMRGNGGNNVFIGGQGNDTKTGGNGRNTYKWSLGDGNDIINDHATNKDANGWGGTLKFGEGVDPANIEISRVSNNLILIIEETGERLTIQNWFSGVDHQLIDIRFADGTVWSRADVNAMSPVIRGADGNVAVNGFTNSNDILIGGNGNNTMRGNGGNNIFIGGQGNDTKTGGNGRNTYKWSLGDGNDTINDHATNKDANGWGGTLKIGEGVDPANVEISRVGNNLILIIAETGERLTIQDWFRGADWQLNRIEFADGTYWNRSSGQSVEAFFQEQAELAAASELLTPQSASLFSFGCDISLTSSFETYDNTAAGNPAGFINDQTAVDVALACLQMETDSGMVCSTENANSSLNSTSALAISSGSYAHMYEEQFSSRHVA